MERAMVLGRLRVILHDHFGKDAAVLEPSATLAGTLMLDALDLVDLVFFLGREFEVYAPVEEVAGARSLGGLADLIVGRRGHGLASVAGY